MKINELNIKERNQFYNDSDIFNTRPQKTPEKFRYKGFMLHPRLNNFHDNLNSNSKLQSHKINKERYYKNKKDHIKEVCLISNTPYPYSMTDYKKYKTIGNLKKDSKKLQLDKSCEYNFEYNNNIYKNISLHGKKGTLILGNEPPNFSSEYHSMQNYAEKMMLKKKINREKMSSDQLNKSVDIPHKFLSLRRKNYKKNHLTKYLFTKNTIDSSLNKSTDDIIFSSEYPLKANKLNYYKSNIFFDKEKEKTIETFDKIVNENKALKKQEKIKNLEKIKSHEPSNKKGKKNFLYDDLNKITIQNEEIGQKFNREGNFPPKYANFKPTKEIKIKSLDDIYNSKNKRLYKGLSDLDRNTDKYEILDITNNDKFDSLEIKNMFSKNGIHMFGALTFSSYIENGKKGKFVFNIRKDLKDKDFNNKLKKVQNILMKKQGIIFNIDNRKLNYNKKIRTDITPTLVPFRGIKTDKYKRVQTNLV